MERRFVVFIVLSILVLVGNLFLQTWLRGKQPPQPVAQQKADDKKADEKKPAEQPAGDKGGNEAKPAEANVGPAAEAAPGEIAEAPEPEAQWFTLGSADPSDQNPYRLLATVTNQGAAVERIELSSPRFRDLEDRSGYLGHLAAETDRAAGVKINVVGKGTPADSAGLMAGDVITQFDGQSLTDADSLITALRRTRPGQIVDLNVTRNGKPQTLGVTLARRPLEVVRPESIPKGSQIPEPLSIVGANNHDPFSFLLTLWQIDDKKIADDLTPEAALDAELSGVKLRSARWTGGYKQLPNGREDRDTVEFTRELPKLGLKVVKRYTIAKVDGDKPANHLSLQVEIHNVGKTERKVAYQLDGPTGLPTEGWWYATRMLREWGGAGIRDTAMLLRDKAPALDQSDGHRRRQTRSTLPPGRTRYAVGVCRCRCPILRLGTPAGTVQGSRTMVGADQTDFGRKDAGRCTF